MDNKTIIVNLKGQLDTFLNEFADEFLVRVRARTPWVTGDLNKGFSTKVVDNTVELYNTMPYFDFVEYGTPRMTPRRMVTRTVLEAEDITNKVLRRIKKG